MRIVFALTSALAVQKASRTLNQDLIKLVIQQEYQRQVPLLVRFFFTERAVLASMEQSFFLTQRTHCRRRYSGGRSSIFPAFFNPHRLISFGNSISQFGLLVNLGIFFFGLALLFFDVGSFFLFIRLPRREFFSLRCLIPNCRAKNRLGLDFC